MGWFRANLDWITFFNPYQTFMQSQPDLVGVDELTQPREEFLPDTRTYFPLGVDLRLSLNQIGAEAIERVAT